MATEIRRDPISLAADDDDDDDGDDKNDVMLIIIKRGQSPELLAYTVVAVARTPHGHLDSDIRTVL
jgi:hypothetical protein